METMTQNTLADLRSMEHAAEDKQDRYLLGLCTLFVATIEDAKDRISQLELVFCTQLFPAFQAKLLESRQSLQHSESIHKKALEDWESGREELLLEIQELRADRESQISQLRQELQGLLGEIQARREEASQCKLELQEQSKLHRKEVEELRQELSRLRREMKLHEVQDLDWKSLSKEQLACLADNEPQLQQGGFIQSKLPTPSERDTELSLRSTKSLHENQYTDQHFSQIPAILGSQKSKTLPSTPAVPHTSCSDARNLQLRLEQKSQERSLECFRRQLLSAEVEKEKKATRAALVKLHSLKKRYKSLRKQYTVLFRHSHLLDLQNHAGNCKLASGEDVVADEKRETDNNQDSSSSVEALLPLENVQQKTIAGARLHRPDQNGWFPVQKRASTSNECPKTFKSLKTTWRNTRARSDINGFDPHDDFLDTPQENVLKSHIHNARHSKPESNAVHSEEAVASTRKDDISPRPKQEQLRGRDISFSQITTQAPDPEAELTVHANKNEKPNEHTGSKHLPDGQITEKHGEKHEHGIQGVVSDKNRKVSGSAKSKAKGMPVSKQGPMYKFVEPVRRKGEREKLQGVECNQCKKFYDAVLVNEGPGAVSGRCEHHDAISRHRYRYVPPATPEGFWNIGFDSEV